MTKMKQIYLMRPHIGEDEIKLVQEVIASKYLVEGPMTRELERLISDYVNATYAVTCTSATTGLEMCLRAIGVGPGDEVIVPGFTHPATALCVLVVGAQPVIVGVDLDTRNTTAAYIAPAVTESTKAAIPVSWGGHPLDIDPINELAKKHGFNVIDDAACSLGTSLNGKRTGSQTDFTVFSFHPRKLLATGDGGCITTNNSHAAEHLNSYKRFGVAKVDGQHRFVQLGTNQRFSNLLAAVAVGQLRRMDSIIDDRIARAHIYNELMADIPGISIPFMMDSAKHTYQSYTILLEESGKRDYIVHELKKQNIETRAGAEAIYREPVLKDARVVGDMNNVDNLADNLLTLPLHHELTRDDQEYVVNQLTSLL